MRETVAEEGSEDGWIGLDGWMILRSHFFFVPVEKEFGLGEFFSLVWIGWGQNYFVSWIEEEEEEEEEYKYPTSRSKF